MVSQTSNNQELAITIDFLVIVRLVNRNFSVCVCVYVCVCACVCVCTQ